MSGDDKSKRGSPDRKLISLTERYEVRDRVKRFGVSEEEFRRAAEKVGRSRGGR
jgi:hypothetical protein